LRMLGVPLARRAMRCGDRASDHCAAGAALPWSRVQKMAQPTLRLVKIAAPIPNQL
jgi:hypothetical protein